MDILCKQYILIERYLPARYGLEDPSLIKQVHIIPFYTSILGITFDTVPPVLYTTSFYNIFFYNPQFSEDFFVEILTLQ